MTHQIFFAGTAIDPVVGMAMFLGTAFFLHLAISGILGFTSRILVSQPKRNTTARRVFWSFFLIGGIYLLPILLQPIYQFSFIEVHLQLLLIGYGVLGILLPVLTFLLPRNKK